MKSNNGIKGGGKPPRLIPVVMRGSENEIIHEDYC